MIPPRLPPPAAAAVPQEWLVTEKWSIMIKMERTARGKKEKEAVLSRKKKELRQAVSHCETLCALALAHAQPLESPRPQSELNKAKKEMERAAVAAGCWDPKEVKNSAKNWDKTTIARLVAVNYKYGYPQEESDWDMWADALPKKKRSDILKMVGVALRRFHARPTLLTPDTCAYRRIR